MRRFVKRGINFVDRHPRTGWYLAAYASFVVTANILYDIVQRLI